MELDFLVLWSESVSTSNPNELKKSSFLPRDRRLQKIWDVKLCILAITSENWVSRKGVIKQCKTKEKPDIYECGTCLTCTVLEETDKVTFNSCQETVMIKNEMDCSCKDIIYLLTCSGCKKQYIRETNNLRARVRTHKQQILDPRLRHPYMSHHIAHCAIVKRKLFMIVAFFSLNHGDKFYRVEQE